MNLGVGLESFEKPRQAFWKKLGNEFLTYQSQLLQEIDTRLAGLWTKGIISPVVAVSMGAKIIEKHFILDKSFETPDSSFSLDEKQFKKMVNAVKKAHSSIGEVNFKLSTQQISSRNFSRSLYICKDVKKGQIVSEKNVKSVRPGFGLHPKHFESIIGRKFIKNASRGTRLSFELLD